MKVRSCDQFRVTRNSDLWVDEEEVDDLLKALEGELPARRYGQAVRLEVAVSCPEELSDFLLQQHDLGREDLYRVDGPVNLHRLDAIVGLVRRPDLCFPAFKPSVPEAFAGQRSPFDVLDDGDVLLHHPYQSFGPVAELVRRAAVDPQVLAIKQTLYRTDTDSELVEALLGAARAGKAVTVLVELRARFDEATNIRIANRFQQAGVNVVYGVVGYKTHAKMLMIVRRGSDGELRRYVHLGTGNYHATTARHYTDFGLLTTDQRVGRDVDRLFQQLTGLGKAPKLKLLIPAPFELLPALLERIEREAEHARAGCPAGIRARMNALTEPEVVKALYQASRAGVPIDLLVRGICRLRPGLPGVSETVRVRSTLGRFLEHSRVYVFENGGHREVWLSSADWMERNLRRRVETCFPVLEPALAERVCHEGVDVHFLAQSGAWDLGPDGRYTRAETEAPNAQQALLEELAAT